MHSSPSDIKKGVRGYMIVFGSLMALTILTVAVASLQVGIALGIVIALIIATVKGSMVAAVFMHLSHEKQWIYGSLLLTLAFFIVLMLVPFLTINDTFGVHRPAITVHEAAAGEHAPAGTLTMSLRAFHLLFIALSVVLAVFMAVWAAGEYRAQQQAGYALAGVAALAAAGGLTMYAVAFRRKTRQL